MFTTKNIIIAVMVVVLLGLGGTAAYFYMQYQQSQEKLNNPEKVDKEETQSLIDRMSKLITLPESNLDEGEPTLATVLDKEKLKEQEFFASAENGDKMLIYTKAQKAYLYRPSTGIIINVAPVNLGANLPTTVLRNGTTSTAVIDNAKTELTSLANITTSENAARTNYTATIVVDVNGNKAEQAKAIADQLGVAVTNTLPSGESKPEADILVIVGTDQQ